MEFIDAILYRKISNADFNNIEGRKQPQGGGGMRYIDAAGISPKLILYFFEYANEKYLRPKAPSDDTRLSYKINACALGTNIYKNIEFAPRNNRRNYNITNQLHEDRHAAWKADQGFPRASVTDSDITIQALIKNLVVFIIRTNEHNYFAGFINEVDLPASWPKGCGLEKLLASNWNTKNPQNGVVIFNNNQVAFVNNKQCPFEIVSVDISQKGINSPPYDVCNIPDERFSGKEPKEISIDINFENVTFYELPTPNTIIAATTDSVRRGKKINHTQAQKNRTIIGNVGEKAILILEKRRIAELGNADLAEKVEWVSQTQGDGLGYDILSFDLFNGEWKPIYIEVKTTTSGINKPFEISSNEVDFSKENQEFYYIYRVFGINDNSTNINYYRVSGSICDHFNLIPTSFLAVSK